MRVLPFIAGFLLCLAVNATCSFERAPKPLGIGGSDYTYLLFEETNRDNFWQLQAPDESILATFREWAGSQVNLDPISLLRRQRQIFERFLPDLVENFDLLLNGKVGIIRNANCIEQLLFAEHAKRSSDGRVMSEFRAAILYNPTVEKSLKVYFASSRLENGAAPPFTELKLLIKEDLRIGYRYLFDLHNHPFVFDNPSGDVAGTVIPSPPDINAFLQAREESGLERALITNGVSTLHLSAAEFSSLVHRL